MKLGGGSVCWFVDLWCCWNCCAQGYDAGSAKRKCLALRLGGDPPADLDCLLLQWSQTLELEYEMCAKARKNESLELSKNTDDAGDGAFP